MHLDLPRRKLLLQCDHDRGGTHIDANAHADSRMQPVSAGLPGWKSVQLLLRYLGVYAAVSSLLCASLFRADAGADPDDPAHADSDRQ